MLLEKFEQKTTKNLLALFCFHLARIPAKIENFKIISFFDQDKTKWNSEFIKLGFHYLDKPKKLNKYYVEALIASKHMTATTNDINHWNDIVKLYRLMLSISNSPIMKLNLCYSLNKARRIDEAKVLLKSIERELPNEHVYFSLVKANIIGNQNNKESERLINQALSNINQKIRRDYILENM